MFRACSISASERTTFEGLCYEYTCIKEGSSRAVLVEIQLDYEQSLFPLRDSLTTLAARHARHLSTPQAISRSLARLLVFLDCPCQSGKRDFP